MIAITGKCSGQIEVKRFYMPGIVIDAVCPNCNEMVVDDFAENYISFPEVGSPFIYGLYCRECEHEWEFKLQLDITLKVISETI